MVDKSRSAEISRLTDLLQNNPGSRLFVPLAEAYLQSDMLEEAVMVLSDGLQTHSNFVAARVMLGKIYLKKAQLSEAKIQFEQVLAVAPSNIPSLKGLAGIFKQEGRLDEAKTTYHTILKIDPGDKEASGFIEAPEAGLASSAAVAVPETEEKAETAQEASVEPPFAPVLESPENDGVSGTPSDLGGALDTDQENVSEAPVAVQETQTEAVHQETEDAITPTESPKALEPHETKTMAALYMKQGHHQKAADIYENLLKRDPVDLESQKGLEEALIQLKHDAKPPLSNTEKIERLQLWLEAIQREKKR